jgi:hypothetical protein
MFAGMRSREPIFLGSCTIGRENGLMLKGEEFFDDRLFVLDLNVWHLTLSHAADPLQRLNFLRQRVVLFIERKVRKPKAFCGS